MKVEILSPPADSFVVGRDLVGFANVGSDPDVWEDLIGDAGAFTAQRGGTTPRLNGVDVGTLTCPLKDADPESDLRLRVGRRVRLFDEDLGRVLWYGRISDIPAADEREYLVTTLVATDAVDELSNARLSGVGTPGTRDAIAARVAQLAETSTVVLRSVVSPPDALPAPSTGWTYTFDGSAYFPVTAVSGGGQVVVPVSWHTIVVGGLPQRLWSSGWPGIFVRVPVTVWPPDEYDVTATVEVTFTYGAVTSKVVTYLALRWDGAGVWDNFTPGETPIVMSVEKTRVDEALLMVEASVDWEPPTADGSGTIVWKVTGVTARSKARVLQAVGLEAPVSEHLTMACDSVGAVWRPTLDGAVEVIDLPAGGTPVARFSDDLYDPDADASYTKLEMGYAATDDLINDLSVTNHGPSVDTVRVYTNPTSIASHGRRSATLATCLATSVLMDERAEEVLQASSTPRWSPRALTYVYDDLGVVPDVYDAVVVVRRGVAHACLVLGVHHEVQPDLEHVTKRKHLVTLTLRKVA